MESKPISEIVSVKLENANLKLQLLQIQANQIISSREETIQEEFKRLKCDPKKWQLDERQGVLIRKEPLPKKEGL
jgi:hypothetical protein